MARKTGANWKVTKTIQLYFLYYSYNFRFTLKWLISNLICNWNPVNFLFVPPHTLTQEGTISIDVCITYLAVTLCHCEFGRYGMPQKDNVIF